MNDFVPEIRAFCLLTGAFRHFFAVLKNPPWPGIVTMSRLHSALCECVCVLARGLRDMLCEIKVFDVSARMCMNSECGSRFNRECIFLELLSNSSFLLSLNGSASFPPIERPHVCVCEFRLQAWSI